MRWRWRRRWSPRFLELVADHTLVIRVWAGPVRASCETCPRRFWAGRCARTQAQIGLPGHGFGGDVEPRPGMACAFRIWAFRSRWAVEVEVIGAVRRGAGRMGGISESGFSVRGRVGEACCGSCSARSRCSWSGFAARSANMTPKKRLRLKLLLPRHHFMGQAAQATGRTYDRLRGRLPTRSA